MKEATTSDSHDGSSLLAPPPAVAAALEADSCAADHPPGAVETDNEPSTTTSTSTTEEAAATNLEDARNTACHEEETDQNTCTAGDPEDGPPSRTDNDGNNEAVTRGPQNALNTTSTAGANEGRDGERSSSPLSLATSSPIESSESAIRDDDEEGEDACRRRDDRTEISHEKTSHDYYRPPHASRRTVEDLEVKEKIPNEGASAGRSTTTRTASQPGAFAVGAATTPDEGHGTILSACGDHTRTGTHSVDNDSQPPTTNTTTTSTTQPPESRDLFVRGDTEETKEEVPDNNDGNLEKESYRQRSSNADADIVPMVVAELVVPALPPIHHVVPAAHVLFDEEDHEAAPLAHSSRQPGSGELPPRNANNNNNNNARVIVECQVTTEDLNCRFPNSPIQRRLAWGLCFLSMVVLFVAIPLALRRRNTEEQSLPPLFSYECFTSTMAMVQAQIDRPQQQTFIMCPNTRIKLGVLTDVFAGLNQTKITHGDVPLMILRENIQVQCGHDGSVHNHCILEGGFLQVLLQWIVPTTTQPCLSGRTDNATIRGMTFTGKLLTDYTLGGGSIVVSNPGNKVTLVDCLWENMTAPGGLVFVGNNPYQKYTGTGLLDPNVADLTIVNSTFRNIVFDKVFMEIVDQGVAVQNCLFQDITISPYASLCGNDPAGWCQGLLFCEGSSICRMGNICIQNFEYAGVAQIVSDYGSQVSLTGTHFLDGIRPYSQANDVDVCSSGLAWRVNEGDVFTCAGPEMYGENWAATTTCTLT